jgi:hypothetical protein
MARGLWMYIVTLPGTDYGRRVAEAQNAPTREEHSECVENISLHSPLLGLYDTECEVGSATATLMSPAAQRSYSRTETYGAEMSR